MEIHFKKIRVLCANNKFQQNLFIFSPVSQSKTNDFVSERQYFGPNVSDRLERFVVPSRHRTCMGRQRKRDIRILLEDTPGLIYALSVISQKNETFEKLTETSTYHAIFVFGQLDETGNNMLEVVLEVTVLIFKKCIADIHRH